jgi:sec-independent protein translocase protein TatA
MFSNFAIFNLGTTELLIILVIILLLFGGKKLPELSRSIGESLKEIRKGVGDDDEKSKAKSKSDNKTDS